MMDLGGFAIYATNIGVMDTHGDEMVIDGYRVTAEDRARGWIDLDALRAAGLAKPYPRVGA